MALTDGHDLFHGARILIFFTCYINENRQHPVKVDSFTGVYHFTFFFQSQIRQATRGSCKRGCDNSWVRERGK